MRIALLPSMMISAAMLTACEPAANPDSDYALPAVPEEQPADDILATASLSSAGGEARGKAMVIQDAKGLRVRIDALGLPAGRYGVHVHTIGDCTGDGFKSAGGHWNPTGVQHGLDNPAGAHLGDMPNLVVGSDGEGTVEQMINGATVDGLLDANGAAVVIHETADDLMTDPSGNSGARIACGVFEMGIP